MRVELIGCGWNVERDHIPAMLQSEKVGIVVTAGVSLERARLAGRIAGLDESACLADYRALLDRDDVDIVSVGGPVRTQPGIRLTPQLAGAAADVVQRQSNIALAAVRGLYDWDRPSGWADLPAFNPVIRPEWLDRLRPAVDQDEAGAAL
jgi:hypothetical protein